MTTDHRRIAEAPQAAACDRRREDAAWQDALLDLALEETFPASDPVSVARIH